MYFIRKFMLWAIVLVGIIGFFISLALSFTVFGMVWAYLFYYWLSSLKKITRTGIECTGNLVGIETDMEGDKSPVVEFTTLNGENVRGQPFSNEAIDQSKLRSYNSSINEEVPILYDPDKPEKFVLGYNRNVNHVIPVIFMLMGLFFVVIGMCGLLGYVKF
jgi:Protein of unknown function (DUF3592)